VKRGYLVALGGVLLFTILVVTAAILQLDGLAAKVVVNVSLLSLILGLWAGTAIVSVEKGYHVVVGIILGFFAPLGLLILTLMPKRRGG
jgi:hypothetical protein